MGWFNGGPGHNDVVWSQMIDYWESNGMLAPGDLATWNGSPQDEGDWASLAATAGGVQITDGPVSGGGW